jgi:hypothetical protein
MAACARYRLNDLFSLFSFGYRPADEYNGAAFELNQEFGGVKTEPRVRASDQNRTTCQVNLRHWRCLDLASEKLPVAGHVGGTLEILV